MFRAWSRATPFVGHASPGRLTPAFIADPNIEYSFAEFHSEALPSSIGLIPTQLIIQSSVHTGILTLLRTRINIFSEQRLCDLRRQELHPEQVSTSFYSANVTLCQATSIFKISAAQPSPRQGLDMAIVESRNQFCAENTH
jgi:hypothetical protein